jgi:hypothetical protein
LATSEAASLRSLFIVRYITFECGGFISARVKHRRARSTCGRFFGSAGGGATCCQKQQQKEKSNFFHHFLFLIVIIFRRLFAARFTIRLIRL